VTDFELAVMKELGDIKSVATAAASASEALTARLFDGDSSVISNLQTDIKEIKAERIRDEKWDRLHNILHYSLTPLVVTAHSIARHFGINI
jgi:hypothetical protein